MYENPILRMQREQREREALDLQNNPYPVEQIPPAIEAITTITANPLVHYQTQMDNDLARLKAIDGVPAKIEAKRKMVPVYLPFVKDYLASGQIYQNPVAVQIMIWLFDIGDIENALNTAFVLIAQKQAMPKRFDSSMETFVCDYTYDWANKLLNTEQSASPYLDSVVDAMDKDFWDLAPMVASKMYVLLAKFKFKENKFAEVVELCNKAESVNPEGAGVKTLKNRAQAKI